MTENNGDKALEMLNEKLKPDLGNNDQENCFRIGKTKNGKRSILVIFTKENAKGVVLFAFSFVIYMAYLRASNNFVSNMRFH